MEKQYSNYINHLGGFNEAYFASIMPSHVIAEYNKMIELLKEYNDLVRSLNEDIMVREGSALEGVTEANNQKEAFVTQEYQLNVNINFSEKKLKNILKEVQIMAASLDIDDLASINKFQNMTETLQKNAKNLANTKRKLESTKRGIEQKRNSSLYDVVVWENKVLKSQNNLEQLVEQIKNQALFLENFFAQDGKQRIEGLAVREKHFEQMFNNIKSSNLGIFYGIAPEIRDDVIRNYLTLFSSYVTFKKTILAQALPIAKNVIADYEKKPVKLEKDNDINIFDYDAEAQLEATTAFISNMKYLPLEAQKIEAQKIAYSINLVVYQNNLCMNIMNGENIEESIAHLNSLNRKEILTDNRSKLFAVATDDHSFSFHNYGIRKLNGKEMDNTTKFI